MTAFVRPILTCDSQILAASLIISQLPRKSASLASSPARQIQLNLMKFDDGLIVHLWSGALLVVHARHNRAVDAEFQQNHSSSLFPPTWKLWNASLVVSAASLLIPDRIHPLCPLRPRLFLHPCLAGAHEARSKKVLHRRDRWAASRCRPSCNFDRHSRIPCRRETNGLSTTTPYIISQSWWQTLSRTLSRTIYVKTGLGPRATTKTHHSSLRSDNWYSVPLWHARLWWGLR